MSHNGILYIKADVKIDLILNEITVWFHFAGMGRMNVLTHAKKKIGTHQSVNCGYFQEVDSFILDFSMYFLIFLNEHIL